MRSSERLWRRALLAALICIWSATGARAATGITVQNYGEMEEIRYPVALLRGTIEGATASDNLLRVENVDNSPVPAATTAVVNGQFRALVELKPGRNNLRLSCGGATLTRTVTYRPMTSPYKVNVVYVTAQDGDTKYLTQRSDDKQDYANRLDIALKLMQTLTAERMNDIGRGRKTFGLEFDAKGKVVVHTVRYPADAETLRSKTGNELYSLLYGWIDGQFPMDRNKNLVVMGFVGYDPVKKEARGHTALGGGGMGLFSANGMFAWPNSLDDVSRAFSDSTPVDDTKLWDDSAYRGTLWGLAATTIGAMLHEMGHTFGLPHVEDGESIMSRGFDHFNRAFLLVEAPRKGKTDPLLFTDKQIAYWDPVSADKLAASPWFQPDAPSDAAAPIPAVK